MKLAPLRLAPTLLCFILGCRATAVPEADSSPLSPAGAGVLAQSGRTTTLGRGALVPAGYFVSTTGSPTGRGSIGDPWTLKQALLGGHPANTVKPGDTVWIRGGTYTGQFTCNLNGTPGRYITFRGYPGENAIIDGNFDPAVPGNAIATITLNGSYQIWRDLHVMNSQTSRLCLPGGSPADARGDGFQISSKFSKVINCIIHDTGEGIGAWSTGAGSEVYGNLIYHNGYRSPDAEPNCAAAIDIPPADESAVALSGSSSSGVSPGRSSTLTFSHNNVAGDYLVVMASVTTGSDFQNLTATYNGVAMTRINGNNNRYGPGIVAMFGLAGPATGTHDVVVSFNSSSYRILGVAQSFANAHQTISATAAGGWTFRQFDLPPFTNVVRSAVNHMIVDGAALYWAYGTGYAPYGDATLIQFVGGGNNSAAGMSCAPGARSTTMGWTWTPNQSGHGHGTYFQEATVWRDVINTTSGGKTLTTSYRGDIWFSHDVNDTICIAGAGPGGTMLITKITAVRTGRSIEVADAPSVSLTGTEAKWAPGKIYRENIVHDQLGYAFQAYGSSGSGALNSTISGNMFVLDTVYFGGLAGYRLYDTVASGNYMWKAPVNLGYHMADTTGFSFLDNYCHDKTGSPVPGLTMTGNTFIGAVGFARSDFPTNTFYHGASTPAANVVVVKPNLYEENRANIYVYNWEDLDSVAVDLSSSVATGTPICIMNAQDYFAKPVWIGTYFGGTVSLPMDGLTAAAGIGYAAKGPTGRAFNAFIVRAQEHESWRGRWAPLQAPEAPPPPPTRR